MFNFALGLLPDYSFLLWSLKERSVKQFLLLPGLCLPCLVLGPLPLSRHRTPSRLCFLARGLRGANLRVPGSLSLLVRGQKRWQGTRYPLVWPDLQCGCGGWRSRGLPPHKVEESLQRGDEG